MTNNNLSAAKSAKNDEFYTQYTDIEREINAYLDYDADTFRDKTVLLPCDDPEWSNFTKYFAQNFHKLGLKKLISTSYAPTAAAHGTEPTLFESDSALFDAGKTQSNGKIFTLYRDNTGDGRINVEDLEWDYLQGDGDFRSAEVTALRDEADIVVTNPPFSLFRNFLDWLVKGEKQFIVIGSMNAITYKEVFPLIKADKLWMGNGFKGAAHFRPLEGSSCTATQYDAETNLVKFGNIVWYTNLDHGRRHQPLALMTEAENKKFSTHKEVQGIGYCRYDNYNAIEVPYVDAIPRDYDGVMGVPLSFLNKYNPEQFEIVGVTQSWAGGASKIYPKQIQVNKDKKELEVTKLNDGAAIKLKEAPTSKTYYKVGKSVYVKVYARILIRHRQGES